MRHLIDQPLYQTLKQYRLIGVGSVIFLGYMMLIAWEFYEFNHSEMTTEGVAGFFTYVAALLGAFIKSLANIQSKHESD